MAQEQLNIIITGKSGVGKSSFLNYLVGKEICKTGVGKAVTQTYFDKIDFTDSNTNVKYCLYDTKGIEPTTTDECVNTVMTEIEKRDKSDDIFNWIHTVYYCFAAPSRRIEPFEISFAKKLLSRGVSLVILLTKKDLVSPQEIDSIKKQIMSELGDMVQIVPVCSVAQRTRKGTSVQEGKADVLKASFLGLWDKLALYLPAQYKERFEHLNDEYSIGNVFSEFLKAAIELFISKNNTDSIKKINIIQRWNGITLTALRNYPTLGTLHLKKLDKDDREKVLRFVEETIKACRTLRSKIHAIDIEKEWGKNKLFFKKVFDFYAKVNQSTPKILYQHKAKDALSTLCAFDMDARIKLLEDQSNIIKDWFNEINSCWFWDSEEKSDATEAYGKFHDSVISLATEFSNLLENFITAYQAELHQYGQYCIRKDTENGECYFAGDGVSLAARKEIFKETYSLVIKRKTSPSQTELFFQDLQSVLNLSAEDCKDAFSN